MDDPSILIKHYEHGESETATVVQTLHQCCCLLLLRLTSRTARVVVHMDILEVLADDLADGGVIRDEVGKAQAPGTPVAAHLTDDELAFRLGFRYCLVYLFDGINAFSAPVHLPSLQEGQLTA